MNPIRKRILVMVVVAPILGLLWILADGTRPYLHSTGEVVVDIPRGAHTSEIARELELAGAIRSRWTFLALHLLRWGQTLKAGEYAFDRPASTLAVLGKLIRGDVSHQLVTIPEGSNRFDIADIVAAAGFSTREEFLRATEDAQPVVNLDPEAKDVEGYLFPDSYQFPRHARPADIVRAMVNRFRQVYVALLPKSVVPRSLHEIVTIASLVEKETAVAEERPIIAGIFYKRLRRGLLLQADPSVVYAALVANRYTGRIRKDDLDFPSPYNTYTHKGLPAGPIANPGKAALVAALRPASTDYLYFVANLDGGHTFSKTLAEHNLAVVQYREDKSEKLQQMRENADAQQAAASVPQN